MLHNKKNVPKIIFMFFTLHFVAGIEKGKSEYVNEFVNELHSNIEAAEICNKDIPNTHFGVFHFTGEDIEAGNFFGLYEDLCETSRPEVITIITVTKYYTEEKDDEGSGNMVKLISGLQKFLKYGNENDIYKTSFGVTVHRVESKYIKDIDTTAANIKKIKMINQELDSESKKHFVNYMRAIVIIHYTTKLQKRLASIIYDQYKTIQKERQNINDTIEERFKNFYDSFVKWITSKDITYDLEILFYNQTLRKQAYKDLYEKIVEFENLRKFKYFTGKKDKFRKAINAALESNFNKYIPYLSNAILMDIHKRITDKENQAKFAQLFYETYEPLEAVIEREKAELPSKIDRRIRQKVKWSHENVFRNIIYDIFCTDIMADEVDTIISATKIWEKTEKNQKLLFGKRTRIILQEELTLKSLWYFCKIFNNIDIFGQFNANQLIYIDTLNVIDCYTIQSNITESIRSESSLFKNTEHFCSNGGMLTISETRKCDQNQSKLIIKKLISLNYNKCGIIEKHSMDDTKIEQCLKKSNISVKCIEKKVHTTNDAVINAMIDKCLAKHKSKPERMVQITIKNTRKSKNAVVYLMLHSIVGKKEKRTEILTMIFNVYNSAIIGAGSKAEDSQRQIKCFDDSHISFLKDLITKIQLTQMTPTIFTIPNFLSTKHADFFYTEKLLDQKFPSYRSFARFKCYGKYYRIKCNVAKLLYYLIHKDQQDIDLSDENDFKNSFLKRTKLNPEVFDAIIENFVLNKSYAFGMANDTYAFQRNDSADEFLISVYNFKGTYAVQICRRKQKIHSMLYFWDTPIEVLTTLLGKISKNSMQCEYTSLDKLLSINISLFTLVVNKLLGEMYFDKCYSKLRANDRKKFTNKLKIIMIRMLGCYYTKTTNVFIVNGEKVYNPTPLKSICFENFLVSKINKFIDAIFSTIDKLVNHEETHLTTILIYKKDPVSSERLPVASDDLVERALYENFDDLRKFEYRLLDDLKRSDKY